jgi:hypothetical protein
LFTTTASSVLPFEHFGSLSRWSVACVGGSPSYNTVPLDRPGVRLGMRERCGAEDEQDGA